MGASPHRFAVEAHAVVGSTQDLARAHAQAGRTGIVVTARRQTAGHGRHNRVWVSPEGNLYASAVIDAVLPPRLVPTVSLAVAVALGEAIEALGARAQVKWPNDVLLGGRKVAGILLEHVAGRFVIGTGVNVAHAPADLPHATSLAAAGLATTPDAVLDLYLQRLEGWVASLEAEGFAPLRAAWTARAAGLGAPLRVEVGARTLHGTHGGVDAQGALVLETPSGPQVLAAGEVHLVRPEEGP